MNKAEIIKIFKIKDILGLFLLTFLIAIYIYVLYLTVVTPFVGIEVQKENNDKWTVSNIEDFSWAKSVGIHKGDIVLYADNEPLNQNILANKFSVVEQIENITIKDRISTHTYHVKNNKDSSFFIYNIMIPSFVFIIMIILSTLIFKKAKLTYSIISLIFFFCSVGYTYFSSTASTMGYYFIKALTHLSFPMSMVFFLYFLLNYFSEKYKRKLLYKTIICLFSINILLFIIDILFFFLSNNKYYRSVINAEIISFSISFLLVIYTMISYYLCYKNTTQEPIMKILLLGIFLSFFPYIGFFILPKFIINQTIISQSIATVFLLFLPCIFTYAVIAKQLFDIDFIIKRIQYYSILSLLPTLLFSLYLITKGFTFKELLEILTLFYIGLTAFLYFKELLDVKLSSNLFSRKSSYQLSLDRFARDISKVMKVSDLERRLYTELKNILGINSISILSVNISDWSINKKYGSDSFPNKKIINCLQKEPKYLSVGKYVHIEHGIIFVLGKQNKMQFIMWIKNKKNYTSFNSDEYIWLATLSNYVSIIYENLFLIEGLNEELEEAVKKKDNAPTWLLRLLFNLSENERRRLAADLHDSALQDQLICHQKLDMILSNSHLPTDVIQELKNVRERSLDIIHLVRETCNELRPPFLKEMGIIEALESLFINTQLKTNYLINFHHKKIENLDLDLDYTLTIYRMVQELLRNADKHSNADFINIRLEQQYNNLLLYYEDNGIGMELDKLKSSFLHMGLSGIRERVSSLNGIIHFESSIGKGFKVTINIPYE